MFNLVPWLFAILFQLSLNPILCTVLFTPPPYIYCTSLISFTIILIKKLRSLINAMSGLEIPGFVIGVGGLAAVFDKACLVWKTIAEAQDFGEDVASWLAQLEMEFYRFQLWWTYFEHLSARSTANPFIAPATGTDPESLLSHIRDQNGRQIENAATSVLKVLEDIERILRSCGALRALSAVAAVPISNTPRATAASQNFGINGTPNLNEEKERRRYREKVLLKRVPWLKRVKYGASPWKESDRDALNEKLQLLTWWNRSLLELLPTSIRDSILFQGPLGYLLAEDEDAAGLSKLKISGSLSNREAGYSARLRETRKRFAGPTPDDAHLKAELAKTVLSIDDFDDLTPDGSRMSLEIYRAPGTQSIRQYTLLHC